MTAEVDLSAVVAHLQRGAALGWDWLSEPVLPDGGVSRRRRLAMELEELDRALNDDDRAAIADEIGDVVIVLVSLALTRGIDPTVAVADALAKVGARLSYIEARAPADARAGRAFSPETLRRLWTEAKAEQRGGQR